MRADSVAASNIKNRIGSKGSSEKVADVRLLLEEKRQGNPSPRQPLNSVRSGMGVLSVRGLLQSASALGRSSFCKRFCIMDTLEAL